MKTRILTLFLSVLMVLSCLTACGGTAVESTTAATTTVATEQSTTVETTKPVEMLDLIVDGKTSYSLVRSEEASTEMIQRITALRNQIKEITGASLTYGTDWIKRGTEVPAQTYRLHVLSGRLPYGLQILCINH